MLMNDLFYQMGMILKEKRCLLYERLRQRLAATTRQIQNHRSFLLLNLSKKLNYILIIIDGLQHNYY
jgi:hypothetical protein